MKKNISKIITSTVVASLLVTCVPAQIFAMDTSNNKEVKTAALSSDESEIMPTTVNVYTTYSIDQIGTPYTSYEGDYIKLYDGKGAPCTRDGETVSAGGSVTYSHTYSGSLQKPLIGDIQAELGYTFGKDKTFQAYKTSAPLKKGEYVIAYYKKAYNVTPITQKKTTTTTGYETVNGVTQPVNKVESKKYTVNCKEAILPLIKLEYGSVNTKSDVLVASETYEFQNDKYVLVDREVY